MAVPPTQNRKPYEATPYAALRCSDAAVTPEPKPAATADPFVSAIAHDYYVEEADKLEQLRAALWAAFQAGPSACIPMPLIDLTIAYTNALRLELNLIAGAKPRPQSASGVRSLPALLRGTS